MKKPSCFAAALFAGWLCAVSAPAAETVKVRGGIHDDYIRLVFNFPTAQDYRARLSDGRLELEFSTAAEFDFRHLLRQLEGLVDEPEVGEEGRRVAIAYLGDRELSHFQIGDKVVIDLLGDNQAILRTLRRAARDAARQAAEQPAAEAQPMEQPAAEPQVIEQQAAEPQVTDQPTAEPETTEPADAEAAPEATHAVSEAAVVDAEADPDGLAVDSDAEPSTPPPAFSIAVTYPAPAVAAQPLPGGLAPWPRPLSLRLDWPSPVRAAAIKRGRRVLLAFDGEAPADLVAQLRAAAPELEALSRLPLAGATLLSFEVDALVEPRLSRSEASWTVDLRARERGQGGGLALQRLTDQADVPRLRIVAADPGPVLAVDETALGERLLVVPLGDADQSVLDDRRFTEFALHRTAQGIAVQAYSEELNVTSEAGGVEVAAPSGLLLGRNPSSEASSPSLGPRPGKRRLFDLAAWQPEKTTDGDKAQRQLQSAVSTAPLGRVNLARLDLARFHFARGEAREALGLLVLIGRDEPRWMQDPELLLLDGASRLRAGDYAAAAARLGHPALVDELEAWPWQGLLAVAAQDWRFADARFRAARDLIDAYPPPLRLRLRLAAAEARLALGDPAAAAAILEGAGGDAESAADGLRLDYLAGRVLLTRDRRDEGYAKIQAVADQGSGAIAALARLDLIDKDLAEATAPKVTTIAALEDLLRAWRGDPFEVALLTRLADLYADQGRYQEALLALRRAVTRFPDPRTTDRARAEMAGLFEKVFLAGGWRDLAPLEALSLYRDFRELTPSGPAGDRLIADLVDSLATAGAYAPAAALLRQQIAERPIGAEKIRIDTRLALLELFDQRPAAALEALAETDRPDLPAGLARARRHLRAKALAETGPAEAALALLAGDLSPDAVRLRLEVHWRRGDWRAAAAVLTLLVGPPPRPGEAVAEEAGARVLDLAVARALAGDHLALAALAEVYRSAMSPGPWGRDFLRLVDAPDAQTAAAIAAPLARRARSASYLDAYRARLATRRLSELI